jgi:hypothetical protein
MSSAFDPQNVTVALAHALSDQLQADGDRLARTRSPLGGEGRLRSKRLHATRQERCPTAHRHFLNELSACARGHRTLLFTLNPQVRCPRQHAFCERHDRFHVEFFEGRTVTADVHERQFLSESTALSLLGSRDRSIV